MKHLLTFLLPILLVSCGITENRDIENVEIFYTEGKIFCRGQYVTINGEISHPKGEWIFYYPNGQIKEEIIYFERYSIPGITVKYDTNGILKSRKEIDDYNNYYYEEYFDNGVVKLDKYYEQKFLKEEGSNFINTLETINEYYPSGKVKAKYSLLHGMYYGEYIEFNISGDTSTYYSFIDRLGFWGEAQSAY